TLENYLIEDSQKIVNAFQRLGYEITLEQAYLLWEIANNRACATWLCVPESDEHILNVTKDFFIEIE
ncbi:MAG: hypothetical protein ABIH42_06705, partial [Planctomycetota bacterium]